LSEIDDDPGPDGGRLFEGFFDHVPRPGPLKSERLGQIVSEKIARRILRVFGFRPGHSGGIVKAHTGSWENQVSDR
jgi:hypothetical protein